MTPRGNPYRTNVILVKIPSEKRAPSVNERSAGVGFGKWVSDSCRVASDDDAVDDDPDIEKEVLSWS